MKLDIYYSIFLFQLSVTHSHTSTSASTSASTSLQYRRLFFMWLHVTCALSFRGLDPCELLRVDVESMRVELLEGATMRHVAPTPAAPPRPERRDHTRGAPESDQ